MKLVHNLKRGLAVTLCAAMLLGDSALLNAANVEGITAAETVVEVAEQKVEETKLVEETTEATEQTEEEKSEEAQDEKKGLATTELNLSDIETTDASLLGTSMVATNSGSTVIEMMQSDASKYAT
ncbi:MAG: hypothetical protein II051_05790, partial [Lachnospiraceae bacterium]|nr:hypothetical protein [Lachnospiraceae bacterium]